MGPHRKQTIKQNVDLRLSQPPWPPPAWDKNVNDGTIQKLTPSQGQEEDEEDREEKNKRRSGSDKAPRTPPENKKRRGP
jgi:hypothetical protein